MKLLIIKLLGFAGLKNQQYSLGKYYMFEKNEPLEALTWFLKADANGHKKAAEMIASIYHSPLHNEEKYREWKEKAEQQKKLK